MNFISIVSVTLLLQKSVTWEIDTLKNLIDCPCKKVETQHAPVNKFQSTEGVNAYLHSLGVHSQITCSGGSYQNILPIRKVKMT